MSEQDQAQPKEMSYAEIYGQLILSSEIVLTLAAEEVEQTKTGLKNIKARETKKIKEEGIIPDSSTLIFEEKASQDFEDCVDLRIILKQKGTVTVHNLVIPEGL